MAEIIALVQRHAQTMTGAKGQPIQRIVIPEPGSQTKPAKQPKRDKEPTPKPPQRTSTNPGKSAKSKAPQISSADKLKAKIEAEKQAKKSSEDETWWKGQLKELEGLSNLDERLGRVDTILRGKRAEKGWLGVEVSLYRVHLVFLSWISEAEGEGEAACERYTVSVLRSIHQLRGHADLFPTSARLLTDLLSVLGFGSFTACEPSVQDDRELGFKFVKLTRSKSGKLLYPHMRIKCSVAEFQLKAYGVYMDRSMDSTSDSRVGFEPDGWQREVSQSHAKCVLLGS